VDPLGHHFHAGGRRPSDYPDASVGNTYFYLSSDLNGCGQCTKIVCMVSPNEFSRGNRQRLTPRN
jgi:hypothetical protein